MEAENLQRNKIHHGHNIKSIRREKGIKQDAMATLVNLSQQTVSRYESMKEIDDEMLNRFAKALDVSIDDIKNMEEDTTTIIIENTNIETNNGGNIGYFEDDNSTKNFNPIEKVVELYERLLQAEKEKNEVLEKRLSALEHRLNTK